MYRNIAVAMMGNDGDERALDQGIALSRHWGSHLTPMQFVELTQPSYGAWSLSLDPRIVELHEGQRQEAQARVDRAAEKIRQAHVHASDVRLVESLYQSPWDAVSKECFSADIIVIGRSNELALYPIQAQGLATVIMQSGLPVLVVPNNGRLLTTFKKAVVAWHPSREACRALHDALPILLGCESVELLSYDGDTDPLDPMRRQALVENLRHHGVKARSIAHGSQGIDIASLIVSHAEKAGADVVVAGTYGHSRLREWAFGGVTRELLWNAPLPVLMSH